MKLTRGQALELHWQMWADMQNELGDKPSYRQRLEFKENWCKEHFPEEEIESNCFLCEYVHQYNEDCECCPIRWDNNDDLDWCIGKGINYESSPISEILALPEREMSDV